MLAFDGISLDAAHVVHGDLELDECSVPLQAGSQSMARKGHLGAVVEDDIRIALGS